MLIEIVHDIDEFLGKIDSGSDIHYEIQSAIHGNDTAFVELILYGIGRKSAIVKCSLTEFARWSDEKVRAFGHSNAFENLKAWIYSMRSDFEEIAESIGATPGKYDILTIRG